MAEIDREALYYDTLKRIASYDSPERLRKRSERDYGLPFEEALEMAYDNIREEARLAIRGKRKWRTDG